MRLLSLNFNLHNVFFKKVQFRIQVLEFYINSHDTLYWVIILHNSLALQICKFISIHKKIQTYECTYCYVTMARLGLEGCCFWGHALIDPLAVAIVFHFTYNLERCCKDGCWQIHGSWSTRCGRCIPFYILLWKMLKRWMIVSNFTLIVVLHNKNVKRLGFFSLTIIQYSEWLSASSAWYPIINGMDV